MRFKTAVFRHRFAISIDSGKNWQNITLQKIDTDGIQNAADGFLWGDYEGLATANNVFYGVFTGDSINRTLRQLDPIFFKAPAAALQWGCPVNLVTCSPVSAQSWVWFVGKKGEEGMSKSRQKEGQMIGALKQVEAGRKVEDVAREVGVSKHTLYAWKAKYGGMDVSQAQEAKQLRDENTKLRKLVADLSLDKEALQSVIRKNGWSS
jgi:putative transposase